MKRDDESPISSLHRNSFSRGDAIGSEERGNGMRFTTSDGRTVRALTHDESFEREERNYTGEDREDLDIGRCLRAISIGRIDLMNHREQREMLGSTDAGGGYLLSPTLSGRFVDLARSASVAMRAGAQTMRMETREVTLAKLASDPTAYWRAEGVNVTASEATFSAVTLRAKTLATIVPISIELMEDASNAAEIAQNAIRAAMGAQLDQAILSGSGAESNPLGITNTTGVNTITSVGTPADYNKFSEAVGDILEANRPNADGLGWIIHPAVAGVLDVLQDTTNQPLMKPDWVKLLNQFPTTGIASGTSIVGDFSQVLVGMRTSGAMVRILDSGQVTDSAGTTFNAASQLMKLIVVYLRADVLTLRPDWFTVLTGITTS